MQSTTPIATSRPPAPAICRLKDCRRKVRTHEGRGKVAMYCSKEHKNLASTHRQQATGPGWSRLGRTMFACTEPGCSTRVWKQGTSCRAHVNRPVHHWAPRILNGLQRHLVSHSDDTQASMFVDDLMAALAKPKARGAAAMVRAFQKDADYQRLRQAAFPGMAPGQTTFHRNQEDRYNRVVAKTYAAEAASRRVPSVASLISGDGRVRQRLPEGFQSRAGLIMLCAVVQQLHEAGLTQVGIARRFGFPIDLNVTAGRSWLVSQLLAVAGRLAHGATTHQGIRRTRWVKATAEAAEYVKAL